MLTVETMQGAIFDLDDTLLDNGPVHDPSQWLHSRSRYAAVQQIATEQSITKLQSVTPDENVAAWKTAKTHTIYGAVWSLFKMRGLVASDVIDENDPYYQLMRDIAERKIALHEPIIREFGIEVPGASSFVRDIARTTSGHVAIATAAVRADVDIFLDKYQLDDLFDDSRIISLEMINKPKPDPQCFDMAFKSLGLPDEMRYSVVGFEDNARGIASAKAAGLFVCAITTRSSKHELESLDNPPDLIADSYAEFSDLLKMPA